MTDHLASLETWDPVVLRAVMEVQDSLAQPVPLAFEACKETTANLECLATQDPWDPLALPGRVWATTQLPWPPSSTTGR